MSPAADVQVLTHWTAREVLVKHISKPTIFPKSASHLMPSHNTLWNDTIWEWSYPSPVSLETTYHSFVKITEFWLIPWVLLEAINLRDLGILLLQTVHSSIVWKLAISPAIGKYTGLDKGWFLHPSPWSLHSVKAL